MVSEETPLLSSNCLTGQDCTFVFYHKDGKQVLFNELLKHPQKGEFLGRLFRAANGGLSATRALHGTKVCEMRTMANSGPRIYYVPMEGEKNKYLILAVGTKNTQGDIYKKTGDIYTADKRYKEYKTQHDNGTWKDGPNPSVCPALLRQKGGKNGR